MPEQLRIDSRHCIARIRAAVSCITLARPIFVHQQASSTLVALDVGNRYLHGIRDASEDRWHKSIECLNGWTSWKLRRFRRHRFGSVRPLKSNCARHSSVNKRFKGYHRIQGIQRSCWIQRRKRILSGSNKGFKELRRRGANTWPADGSNQHSSLITTYSSLFSFRVLSLDSSSRRVFTEIFRRVPPVGQRVRFNLAAV